MTTASVSQLRELKARKAQLVAEVAQVDGALAAYLESGRDPAKLVAFKQLLTAASQRFPEEASLWINRRTLVQSSLSAENILNWIAALEYQNSSQFWMFPLVADPAPMHTAAKTSAAKPPASLGAPPMYAGALAPERRSAPQEPPGAAAASVAPSSSLAAGVPPSMDLNPPGP